MSNFCSNNCGIKHAEIIKRIIEFNYPEYDKSLFWLDCDSTEEKIFSEKMIDLYSRLKKEGCVCLRRIICEQVILKGLCFSKLSQYFFFQLFFLDKEWRTSNEITITMKHNFEQFINQIIRFIFKQVKPEGWIVKCEHAENKKKLIEEFITICNMIIQIGKPLEEEYIYNIGMEKLCLLYLYYLNDPCKAYNCAIKIRRGRYTAPEVITSGNVNEYYCTFKMLNEAKTKHFKSKW